MIKLDEDLRKLLEGFYQDCGDALVNNVHLMDDIFTKVLEQNQKIIEQNNQILSQCQYMKLQSSRVVEYLEKLTQLVQYEESSPIEQTIEDTPPTELRAADVELNDEITVIPRNSNSIIEQTVEDTTPPTELRADVELNDEVTVIPRNSNNIICGQEDAILDPTFETVPHFEDVPNKNSEAPPNNYQVNGETNGKEEEKKYPDWLAKNEFICHLISNQRKMEMLIEPLCRAGSNKNSPIDTKMAKLMANLKEVGSYLECFCVDPEEIEKNEDLKEKFAKLQLFMTETDAEMQKKNATCSNIASLADDSVAETDKESQCNDCPVVEKVAVSGSTEKDDDLNYNTNNSSNDKLPLKRKKDEVKVVEKIDGEKAQVTINEEEDEKMKPIIIKKRRRKTEVQEMRPRPFTRGLLQSRSFTISFPKRLRSGRELVIRTNNIPKRKIDGSGRVAKSLDDCIKSIGKAEQRKLNDRKENYSATPKV